MTSSTKETDWNRHDQKDDLVTTIEKAIDGASVIFQEQKKCKDHYPMAVNAGIYLLDTLRSFYQNGNAYRDEEHRMMTALSIQTLYQFHEVYVAKKARNRIQTAQAIALAGGILILPVSQGLSFVCMAFALASSYISRFWQKEENRAVYGKTRFDPNDTALLEETLQNYSSRIQRHLDIFPAFSGKYYTIEAPNIGQQNNSFDTFNEQPDTKKVLH